MYKRKKYMKRSSENKTIDLYTEAIKLDLTNALYRCNRSAALVSLKMYDEAETDAWYAVLLEVRSAYIYTIGYMVSCCRVNDLPLRS